MAVLAVDHVIKVAFPFIPKPLIKGAPGLVGIIDGSSLFFDAGLTAPISFDASEGRERFVLQAKVKMPDALKEPSR